MTYAEKRKDPHWIAKSERLKEQAGRVCNDCKQVIPKKRALDTHHCWYEFGKEPWDYPDDCFLVLCRKCHSRRQKVQNSAQVVLGKYLRLLRPDEIEVLVFELVAKRQDLENQKGFFLL